MGFDPDQYLSQDSQPQGGAQQAAGGFDPDAYLTDDEPGDSSLSHLAGNIGNSALSAVKWVGDKINRYSAAPTRAAIMEDLNNGLQGHPISAFSHQFGEDSSQAPSGQQIAQKIGISDSEIPFAALPVPLKAASLAGIKLTYSGVAGLGIEALADPTLAGPGILAKGVGRLVSGAADAGDMLLKGAGEVGDAITASNVPSIAANSASNTLRFAKNAVSDTAQGLKRTFNSSVAPDFPEMTGIANRAGISPESLPESVEFGQGSFLDAASRARREMHGADMDRFNSGMRNLQDAVDTRIRSIGGGAPLDPISAGQSLRQGFDQGMQKFWDGIDMTHDEVQKYAPGLMLDRESQAAIDSKVTGIEKYAKGLVNRGIDSTDRTQGQYLLNAIDAYRNGSGSYKQTVEALRSIGQKAFGSDVPLGQIPHDVEKMRDLYFAIDDGLIDTVRKHVNPDFADELAANNKSMSQFFDDRNQVGHILSDPDVAPEQAFQRVIMNGDSDQISALKKLLPPDEFNRQRSSFLSNLIKREPDGSFSLKNFYNAMRGKQNQMQALFSDQPQQLQDIVDFAKLGNRYGNPVMSTSGTGASGILNNLKHSLTDGVFNDAVIGNMKANARSRAAGILPPSAPSSALPSPIYTAGKATQLITGPGASSAQFSSPADRISTLLQRYRDQKTKPGSDDDQQNRGPADQPIQSLKQGQQQFINGASQ